MEVFVCVRMLFRFNYTPYLLLRHNTGILGVVDRSLVVLVENY